MRADLRSDPAGPPSDRTEHARRLFAGLPGTYDAMGRVLSFGRDPHWRRFLVSRIPPDAAQVLDVATGTAAVAIEACRRTGARITGLDQSEPMLREGAGRARRAGFGQRTAFVLGRAEALPFPDRAFDALTFTYLLRYVDDAAATVAELARVVRPGGTMAGLEFHVPAGVWRRTWRAYTRRVMPAIGWAVSPAWREVGRFLGPSIEGFYDRHPLPELLAMWRDAGIADVQARTMTLGGAVVTWGTRRG